MTLRRAALRYANNVLSGFMLTRPTAAYWIWPDPTDSTAADVAPRPAAVDPTSSSASVRADVDEAHTSP